MTTLDSIISDGLALTGKPVPPETVAAYVAGFRRQVQGATASDVSAAVFAAVTAHGDAYALPSLHSIVEHYRKIAGAPETAADIAAGCGCDRGYVHPPRTRNGPDGYTMACPRCRAGRMRHESNGMAYAPREGER